MYVSPSCYIVQRFFKYCVTDDDVGNIETLKHVVTFLKITICFLLSRTFHIQILTDSNCTLDKNYFNNTLFTPYRDATCLVGVLKTPLNPHLSKMCMHCFTYHCAKCKHVKLQKNKKTKKRIPQKLVWCAIWFQNCIEVTLVTAGYSTKLTAVSLTVILSWSTATYSSAGSLGSFQLRLSVFTFAYQVAVCVFKQLMLLGFESLVFWGFSSNGCPHSPTPPCLFLSSTDSFSVDGCLEWGLMAGLRGFASHGSSILSRGWLATVEAPGYPRHPPST